jgi:hypothetical protein
MPDFNAGDFVAQFMTPLISARGLDNEWGRKLRVSNHSIAVVGSLLQHAPRYSWGPGYIQGNVSMYHKYDTTTSLNNPTIFAFRGPKSLEKFQEAEPEYPNPPAVFGDAGLLMSWYYQPHDNRPKHELCLIPHYVDQRDPMVRRLRRMYYLKHNKIHVIEIQNRLFRIMDQLVQCQFVLSSSLHGLIFADSYGIPNAHVILSNGKVKGGTFKFDDYYQSIGRSRRTLNLTTTAAGLSSPEKRSELARRVETFVQECQEEYQVLHSLDLRPYWQACPMHAEAYNRTRQQHLAYARAFTELFVKLLNHRSLRYEEFTNEFLKESRSIRVG